MRYLTTQHNVKNQKSEETLIFEEVFHKQPNTPMDLINMSNEGVTKKALMHFVQIMDSSTNMVADMLPVTLRTIQRYSSNKKFNPTVSEHIIQLVLLVGKGIEVFGSREKFIEWFDAPNTALGGNKPRELVKLKIGAQLVRDELVRIEYGVYA